MENNQRSSSLLNWAYHCQGKTKDELNHSLLCATLELEATRLEAEDELRKREDELSHLRYLLSRAMKERDEINDKCEKLEIENFFLNQQSHANSAGDPSSGISSVDDDRVRCMDSNNGFSSSDCEESIVSSPVLSQTMAAHISELPQKPLPENGRFLQAVMNAGPLLQTLLLAGHLPQWRNPPPSIDFLEIPPVDIPPPHLHLLHQNPPLTLHKKRAIHEGFESATVERKTQRLVLQ